MIRFLMCLGCLLVICPAAFALGEDTEWASGSGGHFALLAQDKARVPLLWMFGPEGARSGPEAVAERYTDPIAAVGARGDALVGAHALASGRLEHAAGPRRLPGVRAVAG